MANESFFEDVFGDPADDPLLESEKSEEGAGGPEGDDTEGGSPSWAGRDDVGGSSPADRGSGADGDSRKDEGSGAEQGSPTEKTIAVEVGQTEGLEEVNRSLEGGWRLIYICLEKGGKAGGKHVRRSKASGKRVLMTLRREEATSLFDFG
jgi:hypothetical protein